MHDLHTLGLHTLHQITYASHYITCTIPLHEITCVHYIALHHITLHYIRNTSLMTYVHNTHASLQILHALHTCMHYMHYVTPHHITSQHITYTYLRIRHKHYITSQHYAWVHTYNGLHRITLHP